MTALALGSMAPLQGHVPFAVTILDRVQEGPNLFSLFLDRTTFPEGWQFNPGQFNMLYVPGQGEAAISIASDPGEPRRLCHTIAVVGGVTLALSNLKPGDKVWLRGPYGGAWPAHALKNHHLLLVGGGVGVPPLMGVVYEGLRQKNLYASLTLVAAARDLDHLVYKSEYEALRRQGVDVRVILDSAPQGGGYAQGRATDALNPLPGPPDKTVALTCGPEIMMQKVAQQVMGLGVPPHQIYISTERPMNCGLGLCGRCQLGPHFTCVDGPVYPYPALAPYLEVAHF